MSKRLLLGIGDRWASHKNRPACLSDTLKESRTCHPKETVDMLFQMVKTKPSDCGIFEG